MELQKGYCVIGTEYNKNGVKTDTHYNNSRNEVEGI